MARQPDNKTVKRGSLHPRNRHHGRYDFVALCKACPELKQFLKPNPNGDQTIDFSDDKAVLCLNRALLAHYYQVSKWCIPEGYLCPPIPGRADYIHYVADLLAECLPGAVPVGDKVQEPVGNKIQVLDVGTGANCIYPIIGSQSYGWQFVATDIDPVSVKSARSIVQANAGLKNRVKVVQQYDKQSLFKGVIGSTDRFDLTLCNPPFHSSMEEAQAGTQRKLRNLGKERAGKGTVKLNFGGQQAELWCPGGEIGFLKRMANESKEFASQVCWFTSLVSKEDNIRPLKKRLSKLGAEQVVVIKMSQGQKISRLIAWSFMNTEQQACWAKERWT
ncbi:23S rRNA (adenine(1618)-N(6))-methyltransferase RlmF [Pseudomonadota bacterium]